MALSVAVEQSSDDIRDVATAATAVLALQGDTSGIAFTAGCVLVGLAGKRLAVPALNWLAFDPPRPDYAVPTRIRRSNLRAEHLRESPRARSAADAFEDEDSVSAAVRALVRAAEREQGALETGDTATARKRAVERDRHTETASERLVSARESFELLATDLRSAHRDSRSDEVRPLTPAEIALVRQQLADARVPQEERDRPLGEPSHEALLRAAESLGFAGLLAEKLAVSLNEWRETTEPELS